jgi:hypothetical protein
VANPARASAPAWSAPELAEAAQAEGLSTTACAVRAAIKNSLKAHGLIERANRDVQDPRDVAWSISQAVRTAARAARHAHAVNCARLYRGAQGRALAAQHGLAVAPPVLLAGPLPERKLSRGPARGDVLPPDDGRVRATAPGPAATRGRWLYFRLLAAANPAANNRAEWRTVELARAAGEALGRRHSETAASVGMAALARKGLVSRTYVNPMAPWAYTPTGVAKARELGVMPAQAAAGPSAA